MRDPFRRAEESWEYHPGSSNRDEGSLGAFSDHPNSNADDYALRLEMTEVVQGLPSSVCSACLAEAACCGGRCIPWSFSCVSWFRISQFEVTDAHT